MDVVTDRPGAGYPDDDASPDEVGDEGAARASAGGGADAGAAADAAAAADAGAGLDLSPRTAGPGAGGSRSPRAGKWPWIAVLVLIVGAIGFVISRAITDATVYYRNTDEAVAQRAEQGVKPFRIQGVVVKGTKHVVADGVDFRITFNGVPVDVHHVGDPPQLFQECIPVVVEGRWRSADPSTPPLFDGGTIIVAHDSNYIAQNSERIKQAEAQGEYGACAQVKVLGEGS